VKPAIYVPGELFSGRAEAGFTMIEALVALAIAASALVILSGRLGASADVQATLSFQAIALDIAANELSQNVEGLHVTGAEEQYQIEIGGKTFQIRRWSEKTELDGFIRRNVAVHLPGEVEVPLFIYQEVGP